jgi:hypothetical protein
LHYLTTENNSAPDLLADHAEAGIWDVEPPVLMNDLQGEPEAT